MGRERLLDFTFIIDSIGPAVPRENVQLEVSFRIGNSSGRDVSGVVRGTIAKAGDPALVTVVTDRVDLRNGQSFAGTLTFTAPPAGLGYGVNLSFGESPLDFAGTGDGGGGLAQFTSVETTLDVAARYFISLDRLHVHATRARQNDTDTVFAELRVGTDRVERKLKEMGDLQEGDDGFVDLRFGPLDIVPDDSFVGFKYSVINLGFGESGQGDARLAFDTISDFSEQVASALAGFGPFWTLVNKFMHLLHSLFYADCDGTVAVDFVPLTGSLLNQLTQDRDIITVTTFYPPPPEELAKLPIAQQLATLALFKSPDGCGDDSRYSVTWTLARDRNVPIL